MAASDTVVSFVQRTEGKNNNFDILRFFLATAVVLTHCFVFVNTRLPEPLDALTRHQSGLGELAVNGFFAISGFLITASWLRSKGIVDYFKRRVLRIYPGFMVAFLFCVLVVGAVGAASVSDYYREVPWLSVVKNMLLLNNFDKLTLPPTFSAAYPQGVSLNGSLWTIKIEFECYVLLALLGLSGILRRRAVVLALCALTFGVYALTKIPYFVDHIRLLGKLQPAFEHIRFVLYFLIGSTFYLYRVRVPYDPRLFVGAALFVVAGAVTPFFLLIMPLCGCYLLFGAAFSQTPCWPRFAEKRDMSYGVYLYGWPIQLLVATVLGKSLNPYVLFIIALPLTCAAAALSWHLIEAPCLALIRRKNSPSANKAAHSIVALAGNNER